MKLTRIRGTSSQVLTLPSGTTVLISYCTPVAAYHQGAWLRTYKRHSVTTTRHINQWLYSQGIDPKSPTIRHMPQEWFDSLLDNPAQSWASDNP